MWLGCCNYLQKITSGKEVACKGSETDRYKRLLATCYMGNINLKQHLIEQGWAVAYIEYSNRYLTHERNAQQLNKRIWNTKFVRPAAFRSGKWQDAESAENLTDSECVIKGNINRKGEKIYHAPWSRSYKRTKINTSKGEHWFCTEVDALEAGRRAPYR